MAPVCFTSRAGAVGVLMKQTPSRVLSLNVRQWVEDLCHRRAQSIPATVSVSSPGKQDGES